MEDSRRDGKAISVFTTEERWELLMRLLGTEWQNEHVNSTIGGTAGVEREAAKALLANIGGLALTIHQVATMILDPQIGGNRTVRRFLDLTLRTKRGSFTGRLEEGTPW